MNAGFAIALGGLLLATPLSVTAQSPLQLEISPFGGGTFFLQDGPRALALEGSPAVPPVVEGARFEDTWSAGVTTGLRFNEWLAAEALLSWVPTWLIGTNFTDGTDVYAYMYGLNAVLQLPLPGPVHPYGSVGLGGATYDYSGSIRSHAHWMTTVAGGVSYELG